MLLSKLLFLDLWTIESACNSAKHFQAITIDCTIKKRFFFLFLGFFLLNVTVFAQRQSYENLLQQADQKMEKKDYIAARLDYDKLIKLKPQEAELRYKRGVAFHKSYDYNKAIIDLSKATLDEKWAEESYLYRGIVRTDIKQYIQAMDDFGKVVKRNPDNIEVYYHRGKCKLKMGKERKGVFDLEVFLEFSDKNWQAYFEVAKDVFETNPSDVLTLQKIQKWLYQSIRLEKNTSNQDLYEQTLKKLGKDAIPADKISEIINTETGKRDQIAVEGKAEFTDIEIDLEIRKKQTWAVIVGVSEYKNTGLNLNFADKDAMLYAEFLKSPLGGNLDENHLSVLLNKQATKNNIIKALREKFSQAIDEDIIIFYMASHGQPDPLGEEVFFLTTDADTKNITQTALAQSDIESYFQQSRAGKKIWLTDACHSGSVGLAKGLRGGPVNSLTNKLLGESTRSLASLIILTASSARESSLEDTKWGGGHGVFTYHLVEGLKGKANKNDNKYVSIRELYEYVYNNVSLDTNGQQHPELKGVFDNRFPLSIVK